ncbi:MAG TPA: fused MFS/spermidine synthase [Bryobacteraceae bacterium]|nr:fused MFS/spermidine synthase [Bryobacteraceae bacterium]
MTRPRSFVAILYGSTIFLSSFLLFLIQPIFAKLILPWFGGSAAVWTTCLVFYQVALLAGYAYAFIVVRRLSPRWQAVLHMVLLAAALAMLPVIPGAGWKPVGSSDPTWRILALLAVVLGLPYFLLSTTGPLLQAWYARVFQGTQPYRLFALSNAGALIALAAYPVLIEPRVATHAQDVAWSIGFAGFAALCGFTAWISRRGEVVSAKVAMIAPPRSQRVMWIALAAAGSMMLLATTNQLTQNVAAVPFLWIVPLAIYLVTFILCFESSRWYQRGLFLRLLAVALGGLGYAIYDIQFSDTILVAIPIFALGLFVCCMFCHGELSFLAPPAEYLTTFYLMIALGGALGAVFVGLIAPLVFSGIYELPIALLAVAGLALRLNWDGGWSQRLLWGVATVAMVVVVGAQVRAYHFNTRVVTRNFYGALRVIESGNARALYHGTVKHGSQFLTGAMRMSPTTYYGPPSGIGLALLYCCDRPKRVGVVGLGAGTVAAYGMPSDEFSFYEINPEVAEIAKSEFSFLSESTAKVRVKLGDARLTLEGEAPQEFDVLAIDAFSGDAIPVHLLTKEVFALYLRHLKPSGILAVHVSNQFLDLAPVVEQLAEAYGHPAVRIQSPRDEPRGMASATWVLVTRNREFLGRAEIANVAEQIPPRALRMWTDDYNNLLQVIR